MQRGDETVEDISVSYRCHFLMLSSNIKLYDGQLRQGRMCLCLSDFKVTDFHECLSK